MWHFLGRLDNKSDLPYHLVGVPPHSTTAIPLGTFSTFGLTLSHGPNIYFYFTDKMSIIKLPFWGYQKNLDTKAFSSTFFSKLVQAVIPPQHDAFVGVQSSSGALKHLALTCKSEMFNCVLPINLHTLRGTSEHQVCQVVLSVCGNMSINRLTIV